MHNPAGGSQAAHHVTAAGKSQAGTMQELVSKHDALHFQSLCVLVGG